MAPTPTPATHCFICPPPNLTQPVMCGVLPPSFGCTQYGCAGGALEARLPTLPLACATAATLCPHCTGMQTPDCPRVAGQPGGTLHTVATVCTQGFPTFCGCTPGFDCMAPPGGVQTHAPICTQGAPTFCGCTPGLDCAGGAARAAFQARTPIGHPTPATHCFVCDPEPLARQAMMGCSCARSGPTRWPTPATHCFVCDPEPLARQAMMGAAAPAAAAAGWPTPATHCFICPPHTLDRNCWGAGPVDARLQTFPCPTPNTICTDPIMRTPDCERFARTLRTSWWECHTQMAGCTVHVCFQAAQPAAATRWAGLCGTVAITQQPACTVHAARPRRLSARHRAAGYSIHSPDRRGSALYLISSAPAARPGRPAP